jgi:deoxycytidine triphosphate deaminase
MFLSAEKITEAVKKGEITISPFDEKMLKKGSYTFTLGNTFRKLKQVEFIDSRSKELEFDEFTMGEEGYLLRSGEFIICHTAETLRLSDSIACILTMRGAAAQKGIDALQCEIYCEPGSEGGWDGKLMLETGNRGPCSVKLFAGIPIIKAVFVRM